jgi:NAD(P)-dependent dehydrogenase (short-subunit alcohol dehydrogenase family)
MSFKARVAVVTGTASGIGRAAALLRAERGAAVVAADVDENCVYPGFVDSPMPRAGYDETAIPAWSRVCPLGRPGRPEEIARAMLFLASDEASFVTGGVALPVDGGRAIL